jgi:aryl-alcohol dehydrogenase-like predicted oxidoreductase
MKMNRLGRTDILVSEICLGTMTWGSQNSEAEAFAQMDYSLERGVNFFDTAELYPTTPLSKETYGNTEEIIGNWLKSNGKRDQVVLATKVAGPGRPYIREGSPITGASLRAALDASLTRLKTDYVDLYQIHWPNRGHFHFRGAWSYNPYKQDRAQAQHDIAEILEALGDCVKAGKIRAIGLSNETTWGTQTFLNLAEQKSPRSRTSTTSSTGIMISISPNSRITRMSGCSPIRRSPAASCRANISGARSRRGRAARSMATSEAGSCRSRRHRHAPMWNSRRSTGSTPRRLRLPSA